MALHIVLTRLTVLSVDAVNGCDSVAVLDLTITQPDTSFTEVTAYESYDWNEQTY